jgi:hypothetical protein
MSKYPDGYAVLDKFDFERPPVGIKFLPFKPKNLSRPDKPLDFCEMLVEAQKGKGFCVGKEDFTCMGPQYWIILTVIRNLYDHTAAASRLEREKSAKFTVTLVRPAIKSHSKIPGS